MLEKKVYATSEFRKMISKKDALKLLEMNGYIKFRGRAIEIVKLPKFMERNMRG